MIARPSIEPSRLRPAPEHSERSAREREIALGLRREDPVAARLLWDHFAPFVRGLLLRALGPGVDVEDAMPAIFARVHRRGGALRSASQLRILVVGTAIRWIRSRLFRQRALRWWSWLQGERTRDWEGLDPSDALALRNLYRALDALPTSWRVAFSLRFFEGAEVSEASAALAVSPPVYERRLQAAKLRLLRCKPLTANGSHSGETGDEAFEALGRLARRAIGTTPLGDRERIARTRFLTRSRPARSNRRLLMASFVATAGLVALALVAIPVARDRFTQPRVSPNPLPTAIPAAVGPLVLEASVLRLAGGTSIRFGSDARGRVEESGIAGGRVRLEQGTLHLEAVSQPGTTWRIEAGPFTLHVTPTRSQVAWWPSTGDLEVILTDGSVLLEGPQFTQRLVAGQVIHANVVGGIVRLGRHDVGPAEDGKAIDGAAQPDDRVDASPPIRPTGSSGRARTGLSGPGRRHGSKR